MNVKDALRAVRTHVQQAIAAGTVGDARDDASRFWYPFGTRRSRSPMAPRGPAPGSTERQGSGAALLGDPGWGAVAQREDPAGWEYDGIEEEADCNWAESPAAESESLLSSVYAATSEAGSNDSASTYETLFDEGYRVTVNLSTLYSSMADALPEDDQLQAPVRTNCYLGRADRPTKPWEQYRSELRQVAAKCRDLHKGLQAGRVEMEEELADVAGQLRGLLASQPEASSDRGALATACSVLNASLRSLRSKGGSMEAMASAALADCEQLARAVVHDAAATAALQGPSLAKFLERVYSGDPAGLLLCTIELPAPRQAEVFDGSRKLRASLGLSTGLRGKLAARLPTPAAVQGWSHGAVHATRDKVKDRALDRIENALAPSAGASTSPWSRILGRAPVPVASDQELRERALPVLGTGLPFMGGQGDRARDIVFEQTKLLPFDDRGPVLVRLLLLRAHQCRGSAPAGASEAFVQALDKCIAGLSRDILQGFVEMPDDRVAASMVDWICDFIEGKASPSAKLRGMGNQVHAYLTLLPDGPRRDMLLLGVARKKLELPGEHPGHLLINSALRHAGQRCLARLGLPNLLETAKRQDLELYPKLISTGHAFDTHVRGLDNEHGKEFRDLLSGNTATQRKQLENLTRKIMRSPTLAYIEPAKTMHFWSRETGTTVVCDPRRRDGGTCFRQSEERFKSHCFNRLASPYPADTYASAG